MFGISRGSKFVFGADCVNEVCGRRKHVKRTFRSPVEGSLAAGAVAR